jgi:hypothetical protein
MLGFKSFRSAAVTLADILVNNAVVYRFGAIEEVTEEEFHRHRTHAHDPEGPVADDRRGVSGSAILFAGGTKPVISTGIACAPRKFATEPDWLLHSGDGRAPKSIPSGYRRERIFIFDA